MKSLQSDEFLGVNRVWQIRESGRKSPYRIRILFYARNITGSS
jgi:hypothetical protein